MNRKEKALVYTSLSLAIAGASYIVGDYLGNNGPVPTSILEYVEREGEGYISKGYELVRLSGAQIEQARLDAGRVLGTSLAALSGMLAAAGFGMKEAFGWRSKAPSK